VVLIFRSELFSAWLAAHRSGVGGTGPFVSVSRRSVRDPALLITSKNADFLIKSLMVLKCVTVDAQAEITPSD